MPTTNYRDGWTRQEPGWWTFGNVGGITKEKHGWYFWPSWRRSIYGRGPYRTMREAMETARKESEK